MIAEILREYIPSVEQDALLEEAMDILNSNDITDIAVTEGNRFLHSIREIDLITSEAKNISDIKSDPISAFVHNDDHIFKAMLRINNLDLSVIPVVDREMQYMGGITKDAIIDYICDSYSIGNEGGILILEETIHDYSMAKISSIIEQEGAKIFGVFVTPVEGQVEKLWISLKLNSLD